MTDELKRLCKEIKRLVPPKEAQSPSGPFETFMKDFGPKITPQELESIHRAYNYFNRLIEHDLNTPVVAEPKGAKPGAELGSKDDKSGAELGAKDDKSGSKDDKSEVGSSLKSSPSPESGNLAPKASTIDAPTTEEMIQILVGLMEAKKD